MTEKFSTALEWHAINLEQIYSLIEEGELVRGTGLAKMRLDGLRRQLEDVQQVIDLKQSVTIDRSTWVKEE